MPTSRAEYDLRLIPPNNFPSFPYANPYNIQLDLMRHLYEVIESRKVAIVESPTGTVSNVPVWKSDGYNNVLNV